QSHSNSVRASATAMTSINGPRREVAVAFHPSPRLNWGNAPPPFSPYMNHVAFRHLSNASVTAPRSMWHVTPRPSDRKNQRQPLATHNPTSDRHNPVASTVHAHRTRDRLFIELFHPPGSGLSSRILSYPGAPRLFRSLTRRPAFRAPAGDVAGEVVTAIYAA